MQVYIDIVVMSSESQEDGREAVEATSNMDKFKDAERQLASIAKDGWR